MGSETPTQRFIARGRRSRFFPTSMVDRVADPAEPEALTQSVVVYFPTPPPTMYQIRPWFGALRALNEVHPVVIVCRDSRTAKLVRDESSLTCLSVSTDDQLDQLIGPGGPKLALYPNLDPLDFDCLRISALVHAYIGHGDSNKGVFASNQIKAFDRYLVAGQAAIDRLDGALMMFDAKEHCIVVGQPQVDGRTYREPDPDARPVIVYAPTWEGGQASQMYSSLPGHGTPLVQSLLADGRFDVVYRPHPLTGLRDPHVRQCDVSLRKLVTESGHRVDTSANAAASFDGASLLVTDASALISEWLPTGRPLLVTTELESMAIPVLKASDLDRAADVVANALAEPADLSEILLHHLTYSEPGAATQAFIDVCGDLIERQIEASTGGGFLSPDAL